MDTLSLKKRKAGGPPTHLTALTVTNDKLKLLIQNILHILTILNIEDAPTNEREYRAMFGHQFMNLCFVSRCHYNNLNSYLAVFYVIFIH